MTRWQAFLAALHNVHSPVAWVATLILVLALAVVLAFGFTHVMEYLFS